MTKILVSVFVGLLVSQIAIYATTIYLHRCLAHRAVTLRPGAAFLFRFIIWVTTNLKPRDWAAVHRKHHRFTDVEGDPHSPLLFGYWKVQLQNAIMYRNETRDPELLSKFAPELKPDRWDRVLFDWWIGMPIGIAFTVWVAGWLSGAIIVVTHILSYLGLSAAINAWGHTRGYRRFDNTARNSWWLALITAGEGLHNNHHGRPASSTMTAAKGEFDPAWPILRFLEFVRLAKLRRPKLSQFRLPRLPRMPRVPRVRLPRRQPVGV